MDKVYDKLKDIYGVLEDTDIDDIVGGFITDPDGTLKKLNDDLKTLQGSMEKLMKALKSGHLRAQVEGDVSDLLVELMDGMTQMTGAELQLSEAKAQIESGLKQIQAAYDKVAEQTDLGGLLSISTVSGLLTAQNFSMPAGYIDDNSGISYMVSVGQKFESSGELEDMVLFDLGLDGVEPITLGDVATVVVTDNGEHKGLHRVAHPLEYRIIDRQKEQRTHHSDKAFVPGAAVEQRHRPAQQNDQHHGNSRQRQCYRQRRQQGTAGAGCRQRIADHRGHPRQQQINKPGQVHPAAAHRKNSARRDGQRQQLLVIPAAEQMPVAGKGAGQHTDRQRRKLHQHKIEPVQPLRHQRHCQRQRH